MLVPNAITTVTGLPYLIQTSFCTLGMQPRAGMPRLWFSAEGAGGLPHRIMAQQDIDTVTDTTPPQGEVGSW